MYKVILQVSLITLGIIGTVMYTLPTMEENTIKIETANAAVEKYQKLEQTGIAYNGLNAAINAVGNQSHLAEIVKKTDAAQITDIITKKESGNYLAWLSKEISQSDEIRQEVENRRKRINTLIPTLNPINDSLDEESITLSNYISYFEGKILKEFKIESLAPLGIVGVEYKNQFLGKELNPAIGFFKADIIFSKTASSKIVQLMNFIHETGDPKTLEQSDEIGKIMSNPLITIDSVILDNTIDHRFPNREISGKISLTFYVRGSSDMEKLALMETFTKRKDELGKNISERLKLCADQCPEVERLKAINEKYGQFIKSLNHKT